MLRLTEGILVTMVWVQPFVALAALEGEPRPVKLIFDTDLGNDVDDVLALAMIHALQSRGECELLAVTVTKDHPLAAAFADGINRFFGRGDIPVGLVQNGSTPEVGKYLQLAAVKDGAMRRYPSRFADGKHVPDALAVLRKTLAAQSDGFVVIVQVGFSTNLAHLLDSQPDSFSQLTGRELVQQKVNHLVVMAGSFEHLSDQQERPKEYNVIKDIDSAQKLFKQWPTSIDFSGFEIGRAIEYPAESIRQDYGYVVHHPVAEAYELYCPPDHNRPTWDLTAVLQAVRPRRGYFGLSQRGRMSVDEQGVTHFQQDETGSHRYFTVTPEQVIRVREAFCCLASQPPTNCSN